LTVVSGVDDMEFDESSAGMPVC